MNVIAKSLHTSRLHILPLELEDYQLFIHQMDAFCTQKHLSYGGEAFSDDFYDVLKQIETLIQTHPTDWVWMTLWLFITFDQVIIGSACFKSAPVDRKVEIGYGMGEKYQNKGYMTEAIEAMITWAFSTGLVDDVTAETKVGNVASIRVLEKLGFRKVKETHELMYWEIGKKE